MIDRRNSASASSLPEALVNGNNLVSKVCALQVLAHSIGQVPALFFRKTPRQRPFQSTGEVKSYYRWKNAFLEGGKQALGDEAGEPDARVHDLEAENKRLKELVADLSIENHLLKKRD
jgi:hypothetical protein